MGATLGFRFNDSGFRGWNYVGNISSCSYNRGLGGRSLPGLGGGDRYFAVGHGTNVDVRRDRVRSGHRGSDDRACGCEGRGSCLRFDHDNRGRRGRLHDGPGLTFDHHTPG